MKYSTPQLDGEHVTLEGDKVKRERAVIRVYTLDSRRPHLRIINRKSRRMHRS